MPQCENHATHQYQLPPTIPDPRLGTGEGMGIGQVVHRLSPNNDCWDRPRNPAASSHTIDQRLLYSTVYGVVTASSSSSSSRPQPAHVRCSHGGEGTRPRKHDFSNHHHHIMGYAVEFEVPYGVEAELDYCAGIRVEVPDDVPPVHKGRVPTHRFRHRPCANPTIPSLRPQTPKLLAPTAERFLFQAVGSDPNRSDRRSMALSEGELAVGVGSKPARDGLLALGGRGVLLCRTRTANSNDLSPSCGIATCETHSPSPSATSATCMDKLHTA